MEKVLIALAIAPIVGVVLGDIITSLIYSWGFGMFTLFGAMLAYPLAIVFALPALFIMRRMHWLSILSFAFLGVLLAVFGWAIAFWPPQNISTDPHAISYGLFGLMSGLFGAVIFWFIGVRGNLTLTHHSSGTPNGAP